MTRDIISLFGKPDAQIPAYIWERCRGSGCGAYPRLSVNAPTRAGHLERQNSMRDWKMHGNSQHCVMRLLVSHLCPALSQSVSPGTDLRERLVVAAVRTAKEDKIMPTSPRITARVQDSIRVARMVRKFIEEERENRG